jgi:hypothetical protein
MIIPIENKGVKSNSNHTSGQIFAIFYQKHRAIILHNA